MKTKHSSTPIIDDGDQLHGATRHTYAIPTYDDGFGPLYIHRDSMGILGIVRAQTWEDAYTICEDEFFPEATEPIDELVREYGFRREHVKVVKDSSATSTSEHLSAGERFARSDDYLDGELVPTFVRWATIETPAPDAWSENELFCESFGFRPNGPNATDKLKHGIYAKDLNGDYLDLLTPGLLADLAIELDIERADIE